MGIGRQSTHARIHQGNNRQVGNGGKVMARISVKMGDEIFVEEVGSIYTVTSSGESAMPVKLERAGLCDACHRNPGDDFQTEFGNLCAGCINTAMEAYIAHLAIEHLMNNDEEIVETLHIMERYDNANNQPGIQHVDFHSSAIDMAWGMTEDDMMQFGMSLSASIRSVIESRALLQRT
jgi:hypothetical protein